MRVFRGGSIAKHNIYKNTLQYLLQSIFDYNATNYTHELSPTQQIQPTMYCKVTIHC